MLYSLSAGEARWLADPEGKVLFAWLFDAQLAQTLFQHRPPTLSLYYLLAMSSMPLFVLFAACDQTASEIGSRYLRFLLPRCNRLEVYLARFVGAVIVIAALYLVTTIAAAIMSAIVDGNNLDAVSGYAVQITASLVLYSMPFVAVMSLCSASVGSAGLSALIGISGYVLATALVTFLSFEWPLVGEALGYILPNSTKEGLLDVSVKGLLAAVIITPIYVVAYGGLGWLVFQRRDI